MYAAFLNGKEIRGTFDLEGGKTVTALLHAHFDAEVALVDKETAEVVCGVFCDGDGWEIYEAEPDVIEVFDFTIIEI